MVIQKLRTVVTIKAFQLEWQGLLDVTDGFKSAYLSLVPDCPLLCSAGKNIHTVDCIDKITRQRVSTMSYRVGFKKSWLW